MQMFMEIQQSKNGQDNYKQTILLCNYFMMQIFFKTIKMLRVLLGTR